ncbi:MAG: SPASM domain-containing protein [Schwartzia sp.]|nr:SPASM domain-containing protein [Schwartzia sp. (in: firmicutes)]
MELALSHGLRVSLRVNVGQENLRGIGALVDDLKARGFIEKEEARIAEEKELRKTDKKAKTKRGYFHYYFKATNDDTHPEKNITEQAIIDELMQYGFTAEEAIERQSQYSPTANVLRELFRKESYPEFAPGYCGSEQGMMVVDPFGRVYSCWDMVARDDDVVGFADPDMGRFLWNFTKAKWRTRTVDLMKACQLCPYAFICRGGCGSRAKNAYGSSFREYCGEAKEIFGFIASRLAAASVGETAPFVELTLSLAGPLARLTEAERATIMATKSQKEMLEIAKAAGLFLVTEGDAAK